MKKLKVKSWKQKAKRGFTIVEVLVAVALFSIVVTIVADVYISTIGSQRRAFGQQDVLDSSRFALESMGRAIRQSVVISASGSTLELTHPTKGFVIYTLENGAILENDSALTADDVVIENLSFLTHGFAGNDGEQLRITTVFTARSDNQQPDEQTTLTLQTTITPRKLQLE